MGKKFKDLGNVVKNKHIDSPFDSERITQEEHVVSEVQDVRKVSSGDSDNSEQEEQQAHLAQEEHAVQDVHVVQETHQVKDSSQLILGTTQGVKGKKLPRINMAFSSETYEYIKRESRMRGLSATAFVNHIIEEYKKEPGHITYPIDPMN